eukprot:SAG11_NODE_1147_length_5683_cov_40.952006_5_plen_190_part_00
MYSWISCAKYPHCRTSRSLKLCVVAPVIRKNKRPVLISVPGAPSQRLCKVLRRETPLASSHAHSKGTSPPFACRATASNTTSWTRGSCTLPLSQNCCAACGSLAKSTGPQVMKRLLHRCVIHFPGWPSSARPGNRRYLNRLIPLLFILINDHGSCVPGAACGRECSTCDETTCSSGAGPCRSLHRCFDR